MANNMIRALSVTRKELIDEVNHEINKQLVIAGCLHYVNGESIPIASSPLPLVVPENKYKYINLVAERVLDLSIKALPFLMSDSTALAYAGYSRQHVNLAEWELQRGGWTPAIARVDMILDAEKLHVLEINTDSPAGMFHTDVLTRLYLQLHGHNDSIDAINMAAGTPICHLLRDTLRRRWRDACSRSSKSPKALEHVAIIECDPLHAAARAEQEYFSTLLGTAAARALICDPMELRFENGKLKSASKSEPIDLVYRRALWGEMWCYAEQAGFKALVDAYMQDAVHMENSLAAQMLGNKAIMAIIKSPGFLAGFNTDETGLTDIEQATIRDNIPGTWFWGENSEFRSHVLAHPARYVLKSCDGYGAREVLLGEHDDSTAARFTALWEKGYIVQQRVQHGMVEMPLYKDKIKTSDFYYVLGAYLVDGKCVAIDAKLRTRLPVNMNNHDAGQEDKSYRACLFPEAGRRQW